MLLSFIVFISVLLWGMLFTCLPLLSDNRCHLTLSTSTRTVANKAFSIWLPIILISLTFGLRYNVGVDWFSYNTSYNIYKYADFSDAFNNDVSYEWLFSCILIVLNKLDLPSFSIFILSTFIALTLYYHSYKDLRILPFGIYTLFTENAFFLFLNIMRQGLAFFILTYTIKYVKERKFVLYTIGVILASGIHKSALIFLPFYLLTFHRKLIMNRWIALILYISTTVFGIYLTNYLFLLINPLLDSTYSQYTKTISLLTMEKGSGLGLLMIHICDVIIILQSPFCNKHFKQMGFDIYYNIFILGVLIENIAGMNMILARIPFCMSSMRIIAGAYTLYLCFYYHKLDPIKHKTNYTFRMLGVTYLCCSILYFIGNIIRFDYSFIFDH